MNDSRRLKKAAVSVALALTTVLLASCEYPVTGPLPEQAAAPRESTLMSGDVIKFTFAGAPELNQSQKIRTDGKINMPLIGEVDAAGKTIASLQGEIAMRYKPQLQNTTVVLTLESSVIQVVGIRRGTEANETGIRAPDDRRPGDHGGRRSERVWESPKGSFDSPH